MKTKTLNKDNEIMNKTYIKHIKKEIIDLTKKLNLNLDNIISHMNKLNKSYDSSFLTNICALLNTKNIKKNNKLQSINLNNDQRIASMFIIATTNLHHYDNGYHYQIYCKLRDFKDLDDSEKKFLCEAIYKYNEFIKSQCINDQFKNLDRHFHEIKK